MKKVLERIVAQPGAPLENEIWLDTSQNPAVMKYWDGDEWKPIAGGESGGTATDVLKYSEQSLTDAQKTQARTNIGAAEVGSGCDCSWISVLPHLTVALPEDVSTLVDNQIVLYEFTSEEDSLTNDPYAYIGGFVYPGIFVNDAYYYRDGEEYTKINSEEFAVERNMVVGQYGGIILKYYGVEFG